LTSIFGPVILSFFPWSIDPCSSRFPLTKLFGRSVLKCLFESVRKCFLFLLPQPHMFPPRIAFDHKSHRFLFYVVLNLRGSFGKPFFLSFAYMHVLLHLVWRFLFLYFTFETIFYVFGDLFVPELMQMIRSFPFKQVFFFTITMDQFMLLFSILSPSKFFFHITIVALWLVTLIASMNLTVTD